MHEDAGGSANRVGEHVVDRQGFLARAAALGLSASSAAALLDQLAPRADAAGRTLRMRLENDIATIDPAMFPTEADEVVTTCVNEGLVTYRPGTFDVVNCLAESFEPSSDKLRYHFKLKRGVEFHKGYGELTSDDVKYSYERIAGLTKPKLNAVYQGDWAALETVKLEGKYAGTIVLKQPFAPLMHSTMPSGSGLVLSKKALIKLGKRYGTHPIGTGPYEFTSWAPKQHVIVQRFEKYAGSNRGYVKGKTFDAIEFLPIPLDSAAETALRAGDLDFSRISTGSVDRFSSDPRFTMQKRNSLDYYFISMNVQDAHLKDRNLRLAIRYAVDVPGIIAAAYDDKWTQAYAILPKNMSLGYWASAPHYKRDVDKARKYAQAANAKGLTLRLAVVNEEADRTAAQVVQSNLKDIGINVNIQAQDSATLFAIPGPGGDGKKRQLIYANYVTEPDPSWSTVWWTCSQMGEWNWDNWCNKSWSALNNAAVRQTNEAKRAQMYVDIQRQWDKQASMIWIAYPTWYSATAKGVNPALRPDGHRLAYAFTVA